MSQIQRSEPGVPERALLCILGMRRPLLGRAERSIPRSPAKGARLWRAGVDGESARRAIMAKATEPLGSLGGHWSPGEEEAFATLRQPVRHEVVTHVSGPYMKSLVGAQGLEPWTAD
jgi:hypothetical protein